MRFVLLGLHISSVDLSSSSDHTILPPPCANYERCRNGCIQEDGDITCYLKKDASTHATICVKRTEPCGLCQQTILSERLVDHQKNVCEQRLVNCKYSKENIIACQMEAHVKPNTDSSSSTSTSSSLPCCNMVYCPFGCPHISCKLTYFPKSKSKQHIDTCRYRAVQCPCCDPSITQPHYLMLPHIKQQMKNQPNQIAQLLWNMSDQLQTDPKDIIYICICNHFFHQA